MSKKVLNIKVGEKIESSLKRAQKVMEKLEVGETPAPYHGIAFADVSKMLNVFTAKRWDLLACLSEHGHMSIAELARELKRDYKNVHNDISALSEWYAVEKDEAGKVFAPYDEIIVDINLPNKHAA